LELVIPNAVIASEAKQYPAGKPHPIQCATLLAGRIGNIEGCDIELLQATFISPIGFILCFYFCQHT
jgi:hypothetical protein